MDSHTLITRFAPGAPPLWRRLGMTDLGAAATLNGATRSYHRGIAFLDVRSGDTPQVSVSLGNSGTLMAVLRPMSWTPATQGLTTLWRDTDGSNSASATFLEFIDGDINIRRADSVDTNDAKAGSGQTYTSSKVVASVWQPGEHIGYVDGSGTSKGAESTYLAVTGLGIGYDPTSAGRELDGEVGLLYSTTALTDQQVQQVSAYLNASIT